MTSTSVREAVVVLVVVTLASLTLTFHLGYRLHPAVPQQLPEQLNNPLNERGHQDLHLNIHRSLHRTAGSSASSASSSSSSSSSQDQAEGPETVRGKRIGSGDREGDGGGGDRGKVSWGGRRGGGGGRDAVGGGGGGGGGFRSAGASGSGGANAEQFRNVLRVLQEREAATVPGKKGGGRVRVVVAGSNPELDKDALLVESALRKHSATVTHLTVKEGEGTLADKLDQLHQGGWSVLLCLNTSSQTDDCVVSASTRLSTLPSQKINIISELQQVLSQPEALCRHRDPDGKGRWLSTSLHCRTLSNYAERTMGEGIGRDSLCHRHPVLLTPVSSTATVQMSLCADNVDKSRAGVALELPMNPLTFAHVNQAAGSVPQDLENKSHYTTQEAEMGTQRNPSKINESDWLKAITWRFPVLVTSLSPLRVYMHSEGVAWDGLAAYLQHKPQRGLSLLEVQQMAADVHDDSVAAAAVSRLEEGVMDLLVHWEPLAHLHPARWCQRCFQLLEVTAVFNTSFHPFILQVGASSLSGRLSSLSEYLVRQTSLNDLAAILTERRSVSLDLARAFVDLGLSTVAQGTVCNADRRFCLGPRELVYLLDNLRERLVKSGWKRVYPSPSSVRFTGLLQAGLRVSTPSTTTATTTAATTTTSNDYTIPPFSPPPALPPSSIFSKLSPSLSSSVLSSSSSLSSSLSSSAVLRTSHLHALLLGLESFFLRVSDGGQTESFEDLNVPIDQSNPQQSSDPQTPQVQKSLPERDIVTGPPCSEEPGSMPYLSSIVTRPALTLRPQFSPFTTEYEAEVEHHVQLVTVWAWSQSCQSQARLEDKHNTDKSANFTLGLGANSLRILVVDKSHEEPWVVNTYTLVVKRLEADHGLGPFSLTVPHVVCSLKQDCSLPYAPRDACGLQPVNSVKTWAHFLVGRARLPPCTSGDAPGQWYVPCSSCREADGRCYWKEAVWSPFSCQEPRLSHDDLQQCFRGRKVLFIGDSTNRGVLHYMSQRVNGSLWEPPDKTHHLKVYPPLNNNATIFSFAYYPQFWLPAMHRPVFDKALYQLIRRTLPLDNSSNTVVVVGGVHWLATHHLKVVQSALAREELTGVQVIVKGLGAGFHQPVSGVHQLSQKEQEKLLWHNQHVLSYAKQHGMDVVDTFNMTMARYSHFLQGRCTCHFHRITQERHQQKGGRHSSSVITYNVEGDINAAYAEMVINRICRSS